MLFCKHDYENIKEAMVFAEEHDKLPIYQIILFKCKKCGKFKKIKF